MKNIAVIGTDGTVRLDNQGQSWTELVVEDQDDLVAIQLSPSLAQAMIDNLRIYLHSNRGEA